MIPSDHYVRFYNEGFKALRELGGEHLQDYWREIGRIKIRNYAEAFREGGLRAAYDYWQRTSETENCRGELILTDDYFEFRMDRCPSVTKILDNDAAPCELYCDHCMGWIEPLMNASGLHAVMDMESRSEPHCRFRIYKDKKKAEPFAQKAVLLARPYEDKPAERREEAGK